MPDCAACHSPPIRLAYVSGWSLISRSYRYARPAVTDDQHPTTPKPRLSRRTGEELPPAELRALARERSEARRAQDWAEADRLRALIEAQGWKVVDKGAEGRVVRAHPEDVVEADGVVRYGWTGAVPEVDGGPREAGTATIVARATPDPDDTLRLISRLTDAPADTQLLIVADAVVASACRHGRWRASEPEVVHISGSGSPGVLLAVALRRARTPVVVVGEGWPAEATAERIPALVALLGDPDHRRRRLVGARLVRPAPPVARRRHHRRSGHRGVAGHGVPDRGRAGPGADR